MINTTLCFSQIVQKMYKVIFKVQKLVLRCKNISCEILAKKDSHTISLCPLSPIHNGQLLIEEETEFLIIQNDPIFLIQVCLANQSHKKLGGEVDVNLADWDQGIHHSTVASLKKSPDRHSLIHYTFLYIRKNLFAPQKTLILCSQYRDHNLTSMEIEKDQLTKKHNKLQAQIKSLKSKHQALKNNQKMRTEEITNKKKDHQEKIKNFQEKIDENNIKNDCLKKKNQEILKMIQLYGKEEIIIQLQKKYPDLKSYFQERNSQKNQISQKISAKSEEGPSSQLEEGRKISTSERRPREERQRSRERERLTGQ